MDVEILLEYFKKKLGAICTNKAIVNEVHLKPSVIYHLPEVYFRVEVIVKHEYLHFYDPGGEFTDEHKKNLQAKIDLNGKSNKNGEGFVSGLLSKDKYWKDLQRDCNIYEMASIVFREMFYSNLKKSSIKLTIDDIYDLPENKYLRDYYNKLDFSKTNFDKLFGVELIRGKIYK